MPRDWRNDFEAIRRHCTCGWMYDGVVTGITDILAVKQDQKHWTRVRPEVDCPLHGDRPEHDLPPEFP